MFGVPSLFGRLFYVLVNSIAILSEDRFLAKIGWSTQQDFTGFAADPQSVKAKLINLINAVRTVLRIPLIAVNALVIVYELLLG